MGNSSSISTNAKVAINEELKKPRPLVENVLDTLHNNKDVISRVDKNTINEVLEFIHTKTEFNSNNNSTKHIFLINLMLLMVILHTNEAI